MPCQPAHVCSVEHLVGLLRGHPEVPRAADQAPIRAQFALANVLDVGFVIVLLQDLEDSTYAVP